MTTAAVPRRLSGRLRAIPPAAWLGVAIGVYFGVSFGLSWLRAIELQTTTWDLGLYQQALWTTAHGHPFYETADVETGGYRSLLQVHTVFLLYAIVPIYAALPSEATLFAIQSAVVALAAVPLYLLARQRTGSPWLGLVAAIVFLAATPTLSSNLYDFHPEAFLPLELFATVLLWERGRYGPGLVVAALGWSTFELMPVLLAFVGLFFLLPSGATVRRWVAASRGPRGWSAVVVDLRTAIRAPRVQASLALLVGSVLAYVVLLDLRTGYLLTTLGTTPLPTPPNGYVIGGTPAALGLASGNVAIGFFAKATYWILLLALLGFVPLFAPRALVLSIPWFAFTLFSANTNYVELGFQYGFIAEAGLFVAFAYGLGPATSFARRWLERPIDAAPPARPRRRPRAWAIGALTVLVVVNVALTPANPWMQDRGLGSAYRISYGGGGGFANVEALVGLVPSGAVVVASDNLFPLVANDPNAYSFFWTQNNLLALPFSPSDPPNYVLLADNRTGAVPGWLATELYNSSIFGVRGVDWDSAAGTLLLFESGYSATPAEFGALPAAGFSTSGASLIDPEAGIPATFPNQPSGGSAANAPGVAGTFLQGPWTTLSPGAYVATLRLIALPVPGYPAVGGNDSVVWIGAAAFGQAQFFGVTLPASVLETPGGIVESQPFYVPAPTLQFEIQGVALSTSVEVVCASVAIEPS